MSTNSLLNMGVRAMFAAQTQLSTTSHNIANASVAGYSRQSAKLATVVGQDLGVGYIGGGVGVETVERAANRFLAAQTNQSQAQSSADSTRLGMLHQLEAGYPLGELGLGQAGSRLFASFGDLAAAPKDAAVREVVLSAVETTASRFRSTGEHLASLQTATAQQLDDEVTTVNGLTEQIAGLNRQLIGSGSAHDQPNDLLDQRDALIAKLSQHIDVSRIDNRDQNGQPDGSVSLFVGGGQPVVLGADSHALKSVPQPGAPDQRGIAITLNGQDRPLSATSLGGGAMAGLLQFQNSDLGNARAELGLMASALADSLNTQHAKGTDLDGAVGQSLLRVGDPVAVAAASNARDSSGAFLAKVSVSRVAGQGAQLQASDYTLQQDPANSARFQVTRLSDGTVFSGLNNGAQLDGFTFDVGTPAPAAQDRFLLQPVSTAAQTATATLTDPRKLAAAGATAAGSGNTNALVMQNLAKANTVNGTTFSNQYAHTVSALGVRVQRADAASQASGALATRNKEQLGSETGVNLEEEAANLLQFQQSYQAAAKVLVTAQKLFDTMLSVMN
ncbi:flagellar hook-associated protein FlgK [Sphaerotilus sp.]|jgi:flagellar hook-associated protein 1|uniref:flagellar hook-associated protein FlgK n=1 Tax=Sphaerotilus sp. TaxID=2093942 RepID=UPI0025E53014|nr:flagellar hook-associated protein FlgK [Sphaerotilus sp.]